MKTATAEPTWDQVASVQPTWTDRQLDNWSFSRIEWTIDHILRSIRIAEENDRQSLPIHHRDLQCLIRAKHRRN